VAAVKRTDAALTLLAALLILFSTLVLPGLVPRFL
jgi:hypothetical protein